MQDDTRGGGTGDLAVGQNLELQTNHEWKRVGDSMEFPNLKLLLADVNLHRMIRAEPSNRIQ